MDKEIEVEKEKSAKLSEKMLMQGVPNPLEDDEFEPLEVEERWKASQAKFWRTDNHGAVTVKSTQQGLNVEAESQFRKRYWHDRID